MRDLSGVVAAAVLVVVVCAVCFVVLRVVERTEARPRPVRVMQNVLLQGSDKLTVEEACNRVSEGAPLVVQYPGPLWLQIEDCLERRSREHW